MYGPPADLQHRQHVRRQRVANHHEPVDVDAVALEHSDVHVGSFVRDDLHLPKAIGQPAFFHLGQLVFQVALGDYHQPVMAERVKHLGHAFEQLHGPVEQRFSAVDDPEDGRRLDLPAADLDGGLDFRQRERLGAIAEAGQVRHLNVVEQVGHRFGVGPRSEQLFEAALRGLEVVFVVPQSVVRVEGDGQHACELRQAAVGAGPATGAAA